MSPNLLGTLIGRGLDLECPRVCGIDFVVDLHAPQKRFAEQTTFQFTLSGFREI